MSDEKEAGRQSNVYTLTLRSPSRVLVSILSTPQHTWSQRGAAVHSESPWRSSHMVLEVSFHSQKLRRLLAWRSVSCSSNKTTLLPCVEGYEKQVRCWRHCSRGEGNSVTEQSHGCIHNLEFLKWILAPFPVRGLLFVVFSSSGAAAAT